MLYLFTLEVTFMTVMLEKITYLLYMNILIAIESNHIKVKNMI